MALNLRDFLTALGKDLIRIDDEVDPITQAGALCSAAPRPILLERLRGFPGWKLCDILVKDRARQALALGTSPKSVVRELSDRMFTRVPAPMAFAIGLHPGYEILANYSGRHEGYDELEMGAGVLGETLELVKCETIDLEVPAQAEVVIEGIVPPGVREPEGPFGEFTGYSKGAEGPAPVFEVTAITRRREPIFRHMQATVFTDHQPLVSVPMEASLYRLLREIHVHPEGLDVDIPPSI